VKRVAFKKQVEIVRKYANSGSNCGKKSYNVEIITAFGVLSQGGLNQVMYE
jgi:hypothetical protein